MAEYCMVITTVSGKRYTTDPSDLTDGEVEQAYKLFRRISELANLSLDVNGTSIIFNPKNIETMSLERVGAE